MRVAIADDAVLLREGIARLLTDGGLDVIATYGDAEALLADLETTGSGRVRSRHQDAAYVHRRGKGLRAAAAIRARWPQIGVLVLSQYVEVGWPSDSSPRAPTVWGTCSKTGSPRARSSSRRFGVWDEGLGA